MQALQTCHKGSLRGMRSIALTKVDLALAVAAHAENSSAKYRGVNTQWESPIP